MLKGKIILIDDLLVRGTTCSKIVKMLYAAGTAEVHVRIACPRLNIQITTVLICQQQMSY